jgi:hypothetical protein
MKTILFLLTIQIIVSYLVYRLGKSFYHRQLEEGNMIEPRVFDIGHEYVKDYSDYKPFEILLGCLVLIPFGLFIVKDLSLLKEFLTFMVTIHIIRLIFIVVTILPKHKGCDDSKYTWRNILNGHCYDKIFSGHFATAVLFTLILHRHYHIPLIYLLAFLAATAWLILATRAHYTIDMLVAVVITCVVYTQNIRFC